jgi:serine/threonine protein kinase
MNPNDAETDAEPLGDLLEAYDEALAAGRPPPTQTPVSPELAERLTRAQACLRRLDQDRRRTAGFSGLPQPGGTAIPGLDLDAGGGLRQLGRLRIVRELGRGGSGIVYLAQDLLLHRQVAVKVPRPEVLLTPDLRRRFLREAQAAAGLDHPNLVPVYEAGEVGSLCYTVSAYCRGTTLGAWLKPQKDEVPPRLAANLVIALADAVTYIHHRGILHRDIKPNNILLVSPQAAVQNTPATDYGVRTTHSFALIPKLTDFGLAKQVQEQGEETKSGTVLGTPLYMAPEQAEGRLRDIGPHTDIYALGVILYELLSGRPPFRGDSDWSIRTQIAEAEPVPPRRLRPEVPRDLETICLKCLQKDPRKRYITAEALADDLRRFQEDRPVAARPVGQVERLWRWCRRRPTVATLLASLVCMFVAGFAGVFWQWRAAVAATEAKELQRQQAEAAREWAERLVYASQLTLAQREWQDNEVGHARELLDACRSALRGWEHAYLRRLFFSNQHTLVGHTEKVNSVAFSPDSKRVASGSGDRTLRVWDVQTGAVRLTLKGHTGAVCSVAFSPDGKRLASASVPGQK